MSSSMNFAISATMTIGHAFHVLLESLLMDNLVKHIDAGDQFALELARKVAVSKAKYPADHVISGIIRTYRPV